MSAQQQGPAHARTSDGRGHRFRSTLAGITACALALAGVSSVVFVDEAKAATISVPTAQRPQAQMANHTGYTGANGTPITNANKNIRYGSTTSTSVSGTISNPSGGSGNTSSNGTSGQNYTNGHTAYVSAGSTAYSAHGRRSGATNYEPGTLDLSNQSAIGFSPRDVASFDTGVVFNLGKMIHSNNPISGNSVGSTTWYRGDMNIRFMGMDMSFRWRMNETANTPVDVDDVVDFLNQSTSETFTYNGLTYTLVVQGFTNNGQSADCPATIGAGVTPANQFLTAERAVTYGCLWASVEQVRPVTVTKVVESPYGTAPAQNFAFTSTSTLAGAPWANGSFNLASNGTRGPLNYNSGEQITITEGAQSAPWAFTSVVCVDGNNQAIPGVTVSGQTVTIPKRTTASTASAAPITCTYTNTYTPRATLTLQKNVVTTGQPAPVAQRTDWTLAAQGEGAVSSQSISGVHGDTTVTSRSVIAGTYRLSELANNAGTTAGYVQDGNWSCTNGVTVTADGKITLTNGQSTTCSVTNKYQTGSFSVTKNVPEGSVTDEDMTFSGEYTCTGPLDSDPPITGSWGPIKAGRVWTSEATIPLASRCKVTSEERSDWPYAADLSYQWDGDADLGGEVVSAVEPATITVTNTTHRVLGNVTWQKVAAGSGDLLAGSTWTLTGPGVPKNTVVSDCTEDDCPSGAYLDQNPAPGEFSLSDLAWGDYALVEKDAPAGYYVNSSGKHFTIGSDEPGALDVVDVGPIENTPINPPTLPLTGGLGTDAFLLAGGGLLALAGIGGWLHRRRSRQLQVV